MHRSREQPVRQFRGRRAAADARRDRAQPARARRRWRAWCSTARSRRRRSTTRSAPRALGFGEMGGRGPLRRGAGAGERRPHPGAGQRARAARRRAERRGRRAGQQRRGSTATSRSRCPTSCRTICASAPTTSMRPRSSSRTWRPGATPARSRGGSTTTASTSIGIVNLTTDAKLVRGAQRRVRHHRPRRRADARSCSTTGARTFLGGNAIVRADIGYSPEGIVTFRNLRMNAPQFRVTRGRGPVRSGDRRGAGRCRRLFDAIRPAVRAR